MTPSQFQRHIFMAGLWFSLWYILALAAYPHFTTISYLGNMKATIVQYLFALSGMAYFLWKAAEASTHINDLAFLAQPLRIIAISMIFVAVTPYTAGPLFLWLHLLLAGIVFTTGLYACTRIAWRHKTPAFVILNTAQWLAMLLLLYSGPLYKTQPLVWRLQCVYQIVFGAIFCLLLALATRPLATPGEPAANNTRS